MCDDEGYKRYYDSTFTVVAVEKGTFCRRIDVSGCGMSEREVAFDAEIEWVRMAEAVVHLVDSWGEWIETRHGTSLDEGELLLKGLVADALLSAERETVRYGCDASSFLEVAARIAVHDYPLVRVAPDALSHIPLDWYPVGASGVGAWLEGERGVESPFLRVRAVYDGKVWSSRRSARENAESFKGMLDAALDGVGGADAATISKNLAEFLPPNQLVA